MLYKENDLYEFAFRRMTNLDKSLSIHGNSIFTAYSRVSKLPNVGISFTKKKTLLVDGARIFNALGQNAKQNCHLIMKVRDPLKLKTTPTSLTYSLKGYRAIMKAWKNKDNKYLKKQLDFFQKVIEKVNPHYCILNSTIDPVSRLLALASRRTGLETVCVQHGIFSATTPSHSLEEDIVDKYFAIDNKQKKIVSKNIPSHKVVSMAKNSEFNWSGSASASVCFVGTDIERYGLIEEKEKIIALYKKISDYLKKENSCKIFYKPHPSETISSSTRNSFNVIPSLERINIDFFIGFASTLIQEMSSLGKPSVQIFDRNVSGINYEDYGYCKTFLNEDGIEKIISECIQYGGTFPCIEQPDLYKSFKTHKIL